MTDLNLTEKILGELHEKLEAMTDPKGNCDCGERGGHFHWEELEQGMKEILLKAISSTAESLRVEEIKIESHWSNENKYEVYGWNNCALELNTKIDQIKKACEPNSPIMTTKPLTIGEKAERVIERLGTSTYHNFGGAGNSMLSASCSKCKKDSAWCSGDDDPAWIKEPCDPNPILIGEVLEKAWSIPKFTQVDWQNLLMLWQPCGFTRSLQEIAEDKIIKTRGSKFKVFDKEVFTPESSALIEFLYLFCLED